MLKTCPCRVFSSLLLAGVLVLLAACGGAAEAPEAAEADTAENTEAAADTVAEAPTEAPVPPTDIPATEEAPTEAPVPPTEIPATEEAPTEAPVPPTEIPATEEAPTEAPTDIPATEEAPTEAPTEAPVPPTETPDPNTYLGLPQGVDAQGVYYLGQPGAPVVLTDYSDFLCPVCQEYVLGVEPDLVATYVQEGVVRLQFRPVLNHGDRSLITSEAAACAGQQNGFWAMHDLLFARMDASWNTPVAGLPDLMIGYAGELGLNTETFAACLAADEALAQVQALDAEQRTRGIIAQPTFEINERRLVGFQRLERFQQVIAEEQAAVGTQ